MIFKILFKIAIQKVHRLTNVRKVNKKQYEVILRSTL